MRRFEGKSALVTGGGTGIGRAIAERLAAEGAFVTVSGRRRELLDETVARITAAGGRSQAVVCDVTSTEDADRLAAAVRAKSDPLDVLVANAGTGGPNPIGGADPRRWREILAVNLDGTYNVTNAVLPFLSDGGRVIVMSSVLGRFGVPGYTAYCTAKTGLLGFTKALALEVAKRRITVNAILPGWVETDMAVAGMESGAKATGRSYEQFRKDALDVVPLQRILQPEEIAGLVAYVASEEAGGLTGQGLGLNAGSHME